MIVDLDKNDSTSLYVQIKDRLVELIQSGLLAPGARLPSTRELASSIGVNRNTVINAYQELEVQGLVSSHVGRGTAVRENLPLRVLRCPARAGGAAAGGGPSLRHLAKHVSAASRRSAAAPGGARDRGHHIICVP